MDFYYQLSDYKLLSGPDDEDLEEEEERPFTDEELEDIRNMMFPNGPSDDEYEWEE